MNRIKKLIFLFFFLWPSIVFTQEQLIDIESKETSLENIILQLESDYGYLFSYQEEAIQSITVIPPSSNNTIVPFLTIILKETNLEFEIINKNYILLSQKEKAPPVIPMIQLCGNVLDSLTQVPLEFANVYIKNTSRGNTTNIDGNFNFKIASNSNDTLIISYIGYQEKQFSIKDFTQKPCKSISLNYMSFGEDFVVVTDYLTNGVTLNNNGAYTEFRPNIIGALPGQAEPDIMKTIQFLPGVSAPDGTASNLNIRGGTSDQNLILWEDIPIYHSAHHFGMISAFNPYITDKVKVFRGGFDAQYGGRISGVIDIKSDDYTIKKSDFGVGANFVNGYTYGKVSLLKNKASIVYSLRHSTANILETPLVTNINRRIQQGVLLQIPTYTNLPDEIRIEDSFQFLDSNIKASFQISKNDDLSISYFYNDNDFSAVIYDDFVRQRQSDSLTLQSHGFSLNWKHQWSPRFSTKVISFLTDYHYDYFYEVKNQAQGGRDVLGIKKSMINEWQVQLHNSYQTKQNHHLNFGYQNINYNIAYQISKQNRSRPQTDKNQDTDSNVQVAYASFNSSKEKKTGIEAGLRVNYFEKEKQFYYEPRLRIWHRLSDKFNLYANAGKYHQFLSQLIEIEDDQSSIDTPVWTLAGDKEVPILTATQFQIGSVFQKKSWLIDIQAYYKNMRGLSSLATGFDEDLGQDFYIGNAKIKGIDILIKKRWKNYRTWVSYSLSKVEHHFSDFFDETFPADNDLPHSFHWVHMWDIGKLECSLGWQLISGAPYSIKENFRINIEPPMMGTPPSEDIRPIIKEFNSGRLPMRHHLDASIAYNILPKNTANWKGKIGLSLFNIYNQINIYDRSFFINGPIQNAQLVYSDKGDLPFTPNLVIRFEW